MEVFLVSRCSRGSLYRLGLEKFRVEIEVTAGPLTADLYGLRGQLVRLGGRIEVTECWHPESESRIFSGIEVNINLSCWIFQGYSFLTKDVSHIVIRKVYFAKLLLKLVQHSKLESEISPHDLTWACWGWERLEVPADGRYLQACILSPWCGNFLVRSCGWG